MSDLIERIREKFARTRRIHENYRRVFESPDGQVVLRHIMKKANVFAPTFVIGDSHQTAFREGQRHLALSIAKYVHKDIEELQKQIEESMQHED